MNVKKIISWVVLFISSPIVISSNRQVREITKDLNNNKMCLFLTPHHLVTTTNTFKAASKIAGLLNELRAGCRGLRDGGCMSHYYTYDVLRFQRFKNLVP